MSKPRCVLDTNVLISAAISPHGTPLRVLRWVVEHGALLASEASLTELRTRFVVRTKFDRYLGPSGRERFVVEVVASSEILAITSMVSVCSDPDDNRFIELTIDGRADCIVTGNTRDFPETHGGIVVMTPAEFVRTWIDPQPAERT